MGAKVKESQKASLKSVKMSVPALTKDWESFLWF
jgi:hypothetical protein